MKESLNFLGTFHFNMSVNLEVTMKKIICMLVLVFTFQTIPISFAKSTTGDRSYQLPINYVINHMELQDRYIVNNNAILVPLKTVFNKLGYYVWWGKEQSAVFINKREEHLILRPGKLIANVNGQDKILQSPIENRNGTTYIPVDFLKEHLNLELNVDIAKGIIKIQDPQLSYVEGLAEAFMESDYNLESIEFDAIGHYSLAFLNLYEKSGDPKYYRMSEELLNFLLVNKDINNDGYIGWGLKYQSDAFYDETFNNEHTVYTYTSDVIGFALVKAYDVTGNEIYRKTANDIKQTLLYSVGYWEDEDSISFWYSNSEYDKKYFVHNINTYTIQLLAELDRINKETENLQMIKKILHYEQITQLENGNWYYCENCLKIVENDLLHWAFSGIAFYRAYEVYKKDSFLDIARRTKKAIQAKYVTADHAIIEDTAMNWGMAELIVLQSFASKHDNDNLTRQILKTLQKKINSTDLIFDYSSGSRNIIDHQVYSWFLYGFAFENNMSEDDQSNITLSNLLLNSNGESIENIDAWKVEKDEIKKRIYSVLGEFPDQQSELHPVVISEEDKGSYIQKKVRYFSDQEEIISAHLLVPKNIVGETPAVLALHQTTASGKDEVVGISGDSNMSYGLDLVAKGYVVLAPDALTAGERVPEGYQAYDSSSFYNENKDWSMIGKAVWDNQLALTYLETLDFVDEDKLFVFGHSEGGVDGMFLAALDDRVKGLAISCGVGTITGDPDPAKWARTEWFIAMPQLREAIAKEQLPFDFHELISLIAPRPFLSFSATSDAVFEHYWGIHSIENEVRKIYKLYRAKGNLETNLFIGEHSFPEANKIKLTNWLEEINNQ